MFRIYCDSNYLSELINNKQPYGYYHVKGQPVICIIIKNGTK